MEFDGETVLWFVAAASLVAIVALLLGKRSDPVDSRLEALAKKGPGTAPPPAVPPLRPKPAPGPAANRVARMAARRLRTEEQSDALRQRMVQAGLYRPGVINLVFGMRAALVGGAAVLGFLVARFAHMATFDGLLCGGAGGLLGTVAPGLWLDYLKRHRQTKIRRALPDALDVMVVCLEGGLSLSGALARIARELATAHPLLAVELTIVERQIQMGRSTGEALREMANRFDLEELRGMASVVVQAEKLGSSVVGALEVFADTLRLRRHQRAEEMAHKASVKIIFPTTLFIFPSIFVVVLGPAAIQIYQTLIVSTFGG